MDFEMDVVNNRINTKVYDQDLILTDEKVKYLSNFVNQGDNIDGINQVRERNTSKMIDESNNSLELGLYLSKIILYQFNE